MNYLSEDNISDLLANHALKMEDLLALSLADKRLQKLINDPPFLGKIATILGFPTYLSPSGLASYEKMDLLARFVFLTAMHDQAGLEKFWAENEYTLRANNKYSEFFEGALSTNNEKVVTRLFHLIKEDELMKQRSYNYLLEAIVTAVHNHQNNKAVFLISLYQTVEPLYRWAQPFLAQALIAHNFFMLEKYMPERGMENFLQEGIYQIIKDNDLRAMRGLLRIRPNFFRRYDSRYIPAKMSEPMRKLLQEHGWKPFFPVEYVARKSGWGKVARYAVKENRKDILNQSIEKGADWYRILLFAARRQATEMVKELLQYDKVLTQEEKDYLLLAVQDPEIKVLLESY